MIVFIKRWPWTVAFLILFIAMLVGFFRVESIQNDIQRVRDERTAINLQRDKQFCRAIPSAAVAGAHALVNVLVKNAHGDQARIFRLQRLGRLYADEARRLALAELPDCPKILVTPPPTTQ